MGAAEAAHAAPTSDGAKQAKDALAASDAVVAAPLLDEFPDAIASGYQALRCPADSSGLTGRALTAWIYAGDRGVVAVCAARSQ